MNCPNCKYPNPPGSAYCGLCYEVLGHSAARQLFQEIHKQKRFTRSSALEGFETPVAPTDSGRKVVTIKWDVIAKHIGLFLINNWRGLLLGMAAAAMLVIAHFLTTPLTRLHLFGTTMDYRFSRYPSTAYYVGFHEDVRRWSEFNAQMDTPLPVLQSEETGSIRLNARKIRGHGWQLIIRPTEWFKTTQSKTGPQMQNIPLTHLSLTPGHLSLNPQGLLLHHPQHLSTRLGRSLNFLLPQFPSGTQKVHSTWIENQEWLDVVDDWKIYWHAEFYWTLQDFEPCYGKMCARMTYEARLLPSLWEAPAWAGNAGKPEAKVTGTGTALFDLKEHLLLSNSFSYQGLCSLPLPSLQKIPRQYRVGRLLSRGPGRLVLDLHNRIEIRKP